MGGAGEGAEQSSFTLHERILPFPHNENWDPEEAYGIFGKDTWGVRRSVLLSSPAHAPFHSRGSFRIARLKVPGSILRRETPHTDRTLRHGIGCSREGLVVVFS